MNRIIDALIDQWLYDISVLSTWWVLWPVIPAMIYCAFMVAKWTFITLPFWLPLAIIAVIRSHND
jgi:hypothetical protein